LFHIIISLLHFIILAVHCCAGYVLAYVAVYTV